MLLKFLYRTSFYAVLVHCINFMKYGSWNFPTKARHFDHRIDLYFLPKWNKICQQVTSVYELLFDAQKISPLSESLLTSTKISKICANAISYLNGSNFWQGKGFFHYFFTKWKVNIFHTGFWYFIKEIALYDVEYSLNFHKNA